MEYIFNVRFETKISPENREQIESWDKGIRQVGHAIAYRLKEYYMALPKKNKPPYIKVFPKDTEGETINKTINIHYYEQAEDDSIIHRCVGEAVKNISPNTNVEAKFAGPLFRNKS